MDSLIIEATEDSPSIMFDALTNRFVIKGESRPENAGKFYSPIINWIVQFEEIALQRKNESNGISNMSFVFNLDYFNSTSAKYILDILLIIKKFGGQGHQIKIEWHYDKRSEDILDSGKEFSDMVDLKFDFVEI